MSARGRGHWCWSCGRVRANERFSGRGHSRHLCRDCARLGATELAIRQTIRNIDSMLLGWNQHIRREQRPALLRFLAHDQPRVRAYAERVFAADALARFVASADRIAQVIACDLGQHWLTVDDDVASTEAANSEDIPF